MGEFDIIAKYFAPLAKGEVGAFDLTDDAAVIALPSGRALVVTKDIVVADVHFMADDEPALVARKLLRVNLSDLAAMGAAPRAYLLGLAVPKDTPESWFASFAAGLAADQDSFAITLVGGDIVASGGGPLTASLTALGEAPEGGVMRRSGAESGDRVYLSGSLGDAALGLLVLKGQLASLDDASRAALVDRYRLPRPRVALGARLVGRAHAAIDISDGLVADLGHICEVSGVAAEIDATRLPLSSAARAALAIDATLWETVLTGGDDYELAFTAPAADEIAALASQVGVPITEIGHITRGDGVTVRDAAGAAMALTQSGYQHI